MSYVKSFKELDRKRRCFSFAGAKVGTLHDMAKNNSLFFEKKMKKYQCTLLILYIKGQEEGIKAPLGGIRRVSTPQKAGAENSGPET